jgi:cell surface protein SprA
MFTSRCMIQLKRWHSSFIRNLNRYVIQGTFTSQGGSEYQLNATNIPQGSVIVTAGATKLVEGNDFTVDYNAGTIRILKPGHPFIGRAYYGKSGK